MVEQQNQNPEVIHQSNEPEITRQNLNSILKVVKKGTVSPEKMEHIINYVLEIAKIESKYSEQKEQIKIDVKTFIEKSIKNTLTPEVKEYNISKFNIDGQEGIDKTEEENYSKAIGESIGQIITLGGFDKFSKTHTEASSKDGLSNTDKYIANKVNLEKYILGEKQDKHFMESLIQKYGMISETQLKEMQEKPFDITSQESRGDLAILIFKEFGDGTEDVLRFLGNIPSGLILLPRYTNYRIQANSDDPKERTDGEIKLKELIEENPSLAILEILGEKGLLLIKQLGAMLTSGKQGDIAMVTVTIAGLVAGGAGLTKSGLNLTRKSAVKSARLAGREARLAGETVSKTTRTALKTGAEKAGKASEVANKIDDIVGGAGIGHMTGAFGKDKITGKIDNSKKLTDKEVKKSIDENPELKKQVNDELIKKNTSEINKFIDDLVEKVDIESIPEKKIIQERAKELIEEIINNPNFSPENLKILTDIRNDIFTNLHSGVGLRNLTHILESITTSSKIPKNEKVAKFLQNNFGNISESEFYTTVTIFHDLVKNTLPTSVVQYIKKDPIEKLSIIKGGQLSSHQLESANFLRSFINQKDSKIYKSIEEFLEKKGIPKEKTSEYIDFIAKTIEGHGGNTEFIQHDSSKAIISILDNVDNAVKENRLDELIDNIITKGFFTEKPIIDTFIRIKQTHKTDLFKKILVKEFIKNNIGKEIKLRDIKLDELYIMNANLNNSQKIQNIGNYINNNGNINIESVIQEKYDLLENNKDLLNKYLHTVDSGIIEEEAARFSFNLNDIAGYANPSTEGFRKLIMFNDIENLISSPLNSSLALLAELKFAIGKETNILYRQKLEKMYNTGLSNIQILKVNYNQKLAEKLPKDTPLYIQELGGNTFGEVYEKAITLIKSKTIESGSDKYNKILQYFRTEFQDMCKNSETKDLFN